MAAAAPTQGKNPCAWEMDQFLNCANKNGACSPSLHCHRPNPNPNPNLNVLQLTYPYFFDREPTGRLLKFQPTVEAMQAELWHAIVIQPSSIYLQ